MEIDDQMDIENTNFNTNLPNNQIKKTEESISTTVPLIEKYRPKSLKDMVSHEDILNTINLFIEKKNIPHFLFHGPPGTGKTSCILAVARLLFGDNFRRMTQELNASDDRGIGIIRNKIKEFCTSGSLITSNSGIKLVILDEADMMTTAAQNALRRIIEKYTKNVRFCLICNEVSRIIPAIQSRCMKFRFNPLGKNQCAERIRFICTEENIPVNEEAIEKIIKIAKGDMRKILNILESTYMSFGLVNLENVFSSTGLPNPQQEKFIFDCIMQNNYSKALEILNRFRMDNGFSMIDIVNLIMQRILSMDIETNTLMEICSIFQKIDYLCNLGGNEKIILSQVIGAVNKLKR